MKRLLALYLAAALVALYLAGNILVFPGPSVCVGWADDMRPSWVCIGGR